MAGGGFVYDEAGHVRLYAKPAALPTSTSYYIGSVMKYDSSETVAVSAANTDKTLSVLIGGRQPYGDDDYCATTFAGLELAVEGVVWVRSATAISWTWMQPAYNVGDGTVDNTTSAGTVVGFYVCDKDKKVAKDRTTTVAGELVGISLQIYTEAT